MLSTDLWPPGEAAEALHPEPEVPVLVVDPSGHPDRAEHVPGSPEAANAPASAAAHPVSLWPRCGLVC